MRTHRIEDWRLFDTYPVRTDIIAICTKLMKIIDQVQNGCLPGVRRTSGSGIALPTHLIGITMEHFRVHPAMGIARVGNSAEYVIAPETMAGSGIGESTPSGGLPIRAGTESDFVTSADVRDAAGALKRQAARFRVFAYRDCRQRCMAAWRRRGGGGRQQGGQAHRDRYRLDGPPGRQEGRLLRSDRERAPGHRQLYRWLSATHAQRQHRLRRRAAAAAIAPYRLDE